MPALKTAFDKMEATPDARNLVYSEFVRRFSGPFMINCSNLINNMPEGRFDSPSDQQRFDNYVNRQGKGGSIMAGLMLTRKAPEGSSLYNHGIDLVNRGLTSYYSEDKLMGVEASDVGDFVLYSTKKHPKLNEIFGREVAIWNATHESLREAIFEAANDSDEFDDDGEDDEMDEPEFGGPRFEL